MARIALIGGHGKVALLASELLTQAGHSVDAIIRNNGTFARLRSETEKVFGGLEF